MNKLQEYRHKAGLTQQQLAEAAGISYRTMQDYEQGTKPLNRAAYDTVVNLAAALGVTPGELFGRGPGF